MGTPIKNRNNEMKAGGHGAVHEYTLTPEELESYRTMPAGTGWKGNGMPIRMRMTKAEAERRNRREGNQNEPSRDCGDSSARGD